MLRFFDILTYFATFVVIVIFMITVSPHKAEDVAKFQSECHAEQGIFTVHFNMLICNHNK